MFHFSRVGAVCALTALMAIPFGLPAESAGPFDGNYRGLSKQVMNSLPRGAAGSSCGGNGTGVAAVRRVADNKIKMSWAQSDIEFSVAADGTISGRANAGASQISASGKITGDTMVMNHSSQYCGYSFEGKKGG